MSGQNTGSSLQRNSAPSAPTSNAPTTGTPTTGTGTTMMQSCTAQIRYKILILEDADGFTHWHICMKLALQDNDLLSVVNGTVTKPNVVTDPDAYANWVSRDLKAQLQIMTMLCKGALNVILQATSAKDCWDQLTAQYQGRGNHCIAYLMQSFYRMPLTDTKPMEPQLNKLVEVNRNLETIRCRVNDKALTYIIVMALLDSLSTLQAILFNNNDVTITLEAVIVQILADEECRVNATGGSMLWRSGHSLT